MIRLFSHKQNWSTLAVTNSTFDILIQINDRINNPAIFPKVDLGKGNLNYYR